jgi:hypothetical protein
MPGNLSEKLNAEDKKSTHDQGNRVKNNCPGGNPGLENVNLSSTTLSPSASPKAQAVAQAVGQSTSSGAAPK